MFKYYYFTSLIIIILFYCGCSTVNKEDIKFPDYKRNIEIVKKIINDYQHLDLILTNPEIVDTNYFKDVEHYVSKLTNHIITHRFNKGYKIEIDDDLSIGAFGTDPPSFLIHKIKVRSKFDNDIIWFGFYVNIGNKNWHFNQFYFCNNPWEQNPHGKPCDKK